MISIIAAVARDNVIGGQNKLLWNMPADLKHFKDVTLGHAIIMGRKTFESIGRPLPNRRNIVITRDPAYGVEGIEVFHSLEDALANASEDSFVIGGAELFRQALPLADKIYLTKIDADFEGEAYFPELGPEWQEVSREEGTVDANNLYPHTFILLARPD
jgi:dihydrofolate reductase